MAIDRDPFGLPELARPASFRTPRTHEHAFAREDLDLMVQGISHIDKARLIYSNRNGPAKLTRAFASGAPHVKESTIRIEDLHAAVVVCHEDPPGVIHGDPAREAEVALQGTAADVAQIDGFDCSRTMSMPLGLSGIRDREMQRNRQCRDDCDECRLRPHDPPQLSVDCVEPARAES